MGKNSKKESASQDVARQIRSILWKKTNTANKEEQEKIAKLHAFARIFVKDNQENIDTLNYSDLKVKEKIFFIDPVIKVKKKDQYVPNDKKIAEVVEIIKNFNIIDKSCFKLDEKNNHVIQKYLGWIISLPSYVYNMPTRKKIILVAASTTMFYFLYVNMRCPVKENASDAVKTTMHTLNNQRNIQN